MRAVHVSWLSERERERERERENVACTRGKKKVGDLGMVLP